MCINDIIELNHGLNGAILSLRACEAGVAISSYVK
jgi:hypothetical protein